MEKTAVYLLEFDITVGPKIIDFIGNDTFDDNEKIMLQSDAFPDIAVQSDQESTIYVFRIGKKFCFSMFTSHPDPSAPRGHIQRTFVISSELPYFYPFTRLLQSLLVLNENDPRDTLIFIMDFLKKWFQNFPTEKGETVELPMFDGSLPVSITKSRNLLLSFYGGVGWTPLSKIYYLNDNFLGFDLCYTLGLQSLISNSRSFDVIRLWEAAVLGESVLVYAATPTLASSCCLSIGSLVFPEKPPDSILPFISVTDQRFQNIGKRNLYPNIIVGVSNPIALTKRREFVHTFTVGFHNEEDGLDEPKMQWQHANQMKSDIQADIRKELYMNTLKIVDIITAALNELKATDPYAEFIGQFEIEMIESQIVDKRPIITCKPMCFAKKLMRSPFMRRIWRRRCTLESLERELRKFNIAALCKGMVEHELVDLISTVMEIRHKAEHMPLLLSYIDRDIEVIKKFLAPDLILAPQK